MNTERETYILIGEISALSSRVLSQYCALNLQSEVQSNDASSIHNSIDLILETCAKISAHVFLKKRAEGNELRQSLTKSLRTLLDIEDNSLLKDRTVRNHISHFDERLFRWLERSKNQTFGRNMLGTLDDIQRLKINREDVMSMYCTRSGEFIFWEDQINIFDLCAEVVALKEKCRRYLAAHSYPGFSAR